MEVGVFDKTEEECISFEDKFLYFMKNLPTFVKKPDIILDDYFEELLQTAEYLKMDMNTQADYERRLKEMRDIHNVEAYARKNAIAEGREEGLQQAKEVISLLKKGLSVQEVSERTGLSEKDVEELK